MKKTTKFWAAGATALALAVGAGISVPAAYAADITGDVRVTLDFTTPNEAEVSVWAKNTSAVTAYGTATVAKTDGWVEDFGPKRFAPGETWTWSKSFAGYDCSDLDTVAVSRSAPPREAATRVDLGRHHRVGLACHRDRLRPAAHADADADGHAHRAADGHAHRAADRDARRPRPPRSRRPRRRPRRSRPPARRPPPLRRPPPRRRSRPPQRPRPPRPRSPCRRPTVSPVRARWRTPACPAPLCCRSRSSRPVSSPPAQ